MLYAQRSTLPGARPRRRCNGEWRCEPTWPPGRLVPTTVALATPRRTATATAPTRSTCAATSAGPRGSSCAGAMPWGQPDDQRPDEIHSLTYTWAPLEDDLEILGHARLRVRVTSSAPVAYLSAKLCDVFPDGTSSLVARGMLNLTHRDSRARALAAGARRGRTRSSSTWRSLSWTFEAGHRIRLDLAGTDWPNAWAPPEPVTLTIDRASATLTLPVLDGPSPDRRAARSCRRRNARGREPVAEGARQVRGRVEGLGAVGGHPRAAEARDARLRRELRRLRRRGTTSRRSPSSTTASSRSRPTTRGSRRRDGEARVRDAVPRGDRARRTCTMRSTATATPTTSRST